MTPVTAASAYTRSREGWALGARSRCPWKDARSVSADTTRGVYIALFSNCPR